MGSVKKTALLHIFSAAALIAVLAIAAVTGAEAADAAVCTDDGITYSYSEKICSGGGACAVVTSVEMNGNTICDIPEEFGGLTVKGITRDALAGNTGLQKISFPDSVETIPCFCFNGCTSLKELDLAMVSEIENGIISGYACSALGCMPSLETIRVSDNNKGFCVDDGVLMTKKGAARLVCYPSGDTRKEYEIPGYVYTINNFAFHGASALEELRFGGNAELYVSGRAFVDCDVLRSIDIGMADAFTDGMALYFRSVPVEEFRAAEENEKYTAQDGVLYSRDMRSLVCWPNGRKAAYFKVPDGVQFLTAHAFEGSSLSDIDIPDTVNSIGAYTFADCRNLESLEIPNKVGGIPEGSFENCDSLKAIVIPPNVKYITSGLAELDVKIKGEEGSYAQEWAEKNRMPFEAVTIERFENSIQCADNGKTLTVVYGDTLNISAQALTDVNYSISDSSVAKISSINTNEGTAVIRPLKAGSATIRINAEGNGIYKGKTAAVKLKVLKASQEIKVARTAYSGVCGSSYKIGAGSKTSAEYTSDDPETVRVSSSGRVTLLRPGRTRVKVRAEETDQYKGAEKTITVTSKLGTPKVRVKKKKGKIKLTWSRIKGASQVQLYIKYPGKKKYAKALTKPGRVKSVTHKGLKKGRVYSYKVRVRTKVNGRYVYSGFSKARTVKAR